MSKSKPKASRKRLPEPPQTRAVSKAEPNVLRSTLKPSETKEAREAEFLIEGLAMNAMVGLVFSTKLGTLDLTECFAQLLTSAKDTATGSTKSQEAILAGQVISTNAMYTDLAIMARNNLDKGLDVFERLMRLALKAQSNCRATAETLGLMQNPRTVFAQQANIANGPQQVNNGLQPPDPVARAGERNSQPNKLLEAHGERLDSGTTRTTGNRDKELAAVGTIHRTAKPRR